MTREFIDFVNAHKDEDTARLLLSAARYPSIDMSAAVQQIEGMQTACEKWPSLLECPDFVYPPRLNREQASSEATAQHKASLMEADTVADLTGGMGIDTLAFAGVAKHVDYVERDQGLCSLMEHNLNALSLKNVDVRCADSMEWLRGQDRQFDLLFVDPARRSASGRKVAAFEDCTPNILEHAEQLRQHCKHMMVKASPMIDIDLACRQLGNVEDVYVVGVKGECKEVLFIVGTPTGIPRIHCHHLHDGEVDDVVFTREDEANAEVTYASVVGKYLYEPNAALMKAGPFKLLSQWEGLEKLAPNTHLYTSDRYVQYFHGRTFSVLMEVSLNRKEMQKWIPEGKAHVIVRNYPARADELQRQLGLKEGGDLFVVATTVGRRKTGFVCCLLENYQQFLKEMNK